MQYDNLLEQGMYSRQLSDLLTSVLQSVTDSATELCDCCHVSCQVIHLCLHLLEIVLHLYGNEQKLIHDPTVLPSTVGTTTQL